MMLDNFCVFILSYNRPDNVPTVQTLDQYGYTGDWYIVVSEDDDIEAYEREHGKEKIETFSKEKIANDIDRGDNFDNKGSPIYARNKIFDIADELGYDYFLVLDEDYTEFSFRWDSDFNYTGYIRINDLDTVFRHHIDFLENSDLDTVAMTQGGDWIGGENAHIANNDGDIWAKRKIMNTFFHQTDNPIEYRGTMNDDVNTYIRNQQLGDVFLTPNLAQIEQERTQQQDGGLTELYKDQGTYIKSFYTLLYSPSSVKLSKMGEAEQRIHHQINWRTSIPKLIPEKYKK
jgi:hypothetical protein